MKKSKKILLTVMSLVFVLSIIVCEVPAEFFSSSAIGYRDPDTDSTVVSIKSQISSIETKLANLEKSISSTSSSITSEEARKEYLDEKLTLVAESITLAENLIAEYKSAIAKTENTIKILEETIDYKYDEFETWIRAFYETGELSYLEMLFDNDNFTDAIASTEYISRIMSSNNDFMDELEEECSTRYYKKLLLEEYLSEQKEAEEKLQLQKQEYQDLIEESENYIAQLKTQKYQLQVEYQQTVNENAELNATLEAELELIAYQNAIYIGGELMWPLDDCYSRISSPYGWRVLFGVQEFHTGIDIPCSYGANVYAANGGTVIKAVLHATYGNYVLIDHGGGKATLYAHNSQLCVKEGDVVKKGDVIALAGSTGRSTGNHVHFEVRINGKTEDPLEYVTQP